MYLRVTCESGPHSRAGNVSAPLICESAAVIIAYTDVIELSSGAESGIKAFEACMKAVLLAYPNTSLVYNTHWKMSGWQGRQGTWEQKHFRI